MKYVYSFLCTGLLALLLIVPVSAQNITAALTGTVMDQGGAVVPGAQIVLTNQATSSKQTTTSNAAGIFVFPSILPGTYSLDVTMAGFRSYQEIGRAHV